MPPVLSLSPTRRDVDQEPSPLVLKKLLVMRGASMPQLLPGPGKVAKLHRELSQESFDEEDMLECDDNVSVTSSQDCDDAFENASVASASDDGFPRAHPEKWAAGRSYRGREGATSPIRRGREGATSPIRTPSGVAKSDKNLLANMNAPAWWAEALSPNKRSSPPLLPRLKSEVDDKVLYDAWWTRVRPARGEKEEAAEDPKAHSAVAYTDCAVPAHPTSQVDADHDGTLREAWWLSVRHRTKFAAEKQSSPVDRSPTSSSDALRHHDYTLARAGGQRPSMRKDFSNRAKLESPVAPLPAPAPDVAASPAPALDCSPTSSSDALRHHDYTLARAGGQRRGMRKDFSSCVKLESPVAPYPLLVAF